MTVLPWIAYAAAIAIAAGLIAAVVLGAVLAIEHLHERRQAPARGQAPADLDDLGPGYEPDDEYTDRFEQMSDAEIVAEVEQALAQWRDERDRTP